MIGTCRRALATILALGTALSFSCAKISYRSSEGADPDRRYFSGIIIISAVNDPELHMTIEHAAAGCLSGRGYRGVPAGELFDAGITYTEDEFLETLAANNIDAILVFTPQYPGHPSIALPRGIGGPQFSSVAPGRPGLKPPGATPRPFTYPPPVGKSDVDSIRIVPPTSYTASLYAVVERASSLWSTSEVGWSEQEDLVEVLRSMGCSAVQQMYEDNIIW